MKTGYRGGIKSRPANNNNDLATKRSKPDLNEERKKQVEQPIAKEDAGSKKSNGSRIKNS